MPEEQRRDGDPQRLRPALATNATTGSSLLTLPVNPDFVFTGRLQKLGSNRTWQRRTFRFDGRHLVCLQPDYLRPGEGLVGELRHKVHTWIRTGRSRGSNNNSTTTRSRSTSAHSGGQALLGQMYASPQGMYYPTVPSPTPMLHSPMTATPRDSFALLTASHPDQRLEAEYHQLAKFTIDLKAVTDISAVVRQLPAARRTSTLLAGSATATFNTAMQQGNRPTWIFVVTTPVRRFVLKASSQREFDTWMFVLLSHWRLLCPPESRRRQQPQPQPQPQPHSDSPSISNSDSTRTLTEQVVAAEEQQAQEEQASSQTLPPMASLPLRSTSISPQTFAQREGGGRAWENAEEEEEEDWERWDQPEVTQQLHALLRSRKTSQKILRHAKSVPGERRAEVVVPAVAKDGDMALARVEAQHGQPSFLFHLPPAPPTPPPTPRTAAKPKPSPSLSVRGTQMTPLLEVPNSSPDSPDPIVMPGSGEEEGTEDFQTALQSIASAFSVSLSPRAEEQERAREMAEGDAWWSNNNSGSPTNGELQSEMMQWFTSAMDR